MEDKELLELAAKAAGIDLDEGIVVENPFTPDVYRREWNPLTDDGDEARLEANLGLNVAWDFYSVRVGDFYGVRVGGTLEEFSRHDGNKQAARRRAGVRAAAEIGRAMP